MSYSGSRVEVVSVKLEPHPNADTLSVVRLWGYQTVVKTADWVGRELGAFIPPDNLVPDTPEYAFLKDNRRVRACKLRGVLSQGLLVPAPPGAKVGEDVAARLGVTHYEPPADPSHPESNQQERGGPPIPVYDLENWERYRHVMLPGEPVVITEKIHGENARFVYWRGRLWAGSRTTWKKEHPDNTWWKILYAYPGLAACLQENEGTVVYGEVFGHNKGFSYAAPRGSRLFAAFDVWQDGAFLNYARARVLTFGFDIPWVPEVKICKYDEALFATTDGGNSKWPGAEDQIREGVVIKSTVERLDPEIGRVALKKVSSLYLQKV